MRVKRPATKIVAAAALAAVILVVVASARVAFRRETPCGAGFTRAGARCMPAAPPCPPPLVEIRATAPAAGACDESDADIVAIAETTTTVGPSDWEAEGRVPPRVVHVLAFRIDRLEVSEGRYAAAIPRVAGRSADPARAASRVSLDEARAYCTNRGGRLPTEDEWIVAAAGAKPRRYPWGDTGAVCLRAAWGLESGPCASGATGPDTVGAHPDGATPQGIHDLAGNVAEWVDAQAGAERGFVKGGSYRTTLATELRTWSRQEVPPSSREAWIGFRCAYDAVP